MSIAIINYNAGNTQSVIFALERIGVQPILTEDKDIIASCDKVIFPGVGEASTTMEFLRSKQLDTFIASLKQPVLGICLGMQLLCKHSEEGDTEGIGVFDISVKKFIPDDITFKVPHMGWNTLSNLDSPIFNGITTDDYVYFVHSYYAEKSSFTIAECDYILPFSAALQKDNFYATQFHPEKSADVGSKILENFISL